MRYITQGIQRLQFPLTNTQVRMHEVQLRRNARVIDELDVTLGFASLASDMHFTRPNMTDKLRCFVLELADLSEPPLQSLISRRQRSSSYCRNRPAVVWKDVHTEYGVPFARLTVTHHHWPQYGRQVHPPTANRPHRHSRAVWFLRPCRLC
jgi:hypothetical protein